MIVMDTSMMMAVGFPLKFSTRTGQPIAAVMMGNAAKALPMTTVNSALLEQYAMTLQSRASCTIGFGACRG